MNTMKRKTANGYNRVPIVTADLYQKTKKAIRTYGGVLTRESIGCMVGVSRQTVSRIDSSADFADYKRQRNEELLARKNKQEDPTTVVEHPKTQSIILRKDLPIPTDALNEIYFSEMEIGDCVEFSGVDKEVIFETVNMARDILGINIYVRSVDGVTRAWRVM